MGRRAMSVPYDSLARSDAVLLGCLEQAARKPKEKEGYRDQVEGRATISR